ncbi:MAG: type II toxin-antitoxin system VapC family toxin [Candidatus Njordarchaeales archaeon]
MVDKALVIDSSIIAALFFPEPYSDWVETVIKKYDILTTVDISYAEVANVAWKRIVIFRHNKDVILASLDNALKFIKDVCKVVSTNSIYKRAIEIAIDTNISIYDSLFLAIASKEDSKFATLDKTLVNKLKNTNLEPILIHPYRVL